MNQINENVLQETPVCFAAAMLLLNLSILFAVFAIIWLAYFLFNQVGAFALFVRQFS